MALSRPIFFLYLYWTTLGTATTFFVPDPGDPLYLTPLINEGKLEEARNKSRVEPLPVNPIESYSGFLTVNETTKSHLFFWFIPKTDPANATTAPLILWLGGGDSATSSLYGLFHGNGPFEVVPNDLNTTHHTPLLRKRNSSWTDDNHMLYIDQPIDTGFSFTGRDEGYVNSTTQTVEQLYVALVQFFTAFSEFAAHDFYVAGESYAGGKYVPALGLKIDQANRRAYDDDDDDGDADRRQPIKLKGMMIGNGFVDPENMLDYDQLLHGVGLIYRSERAPLQAMQEKVKYLIRSSDWSGAYTHYRQLMNAISKSLNMTTYDDYRFVHGRRKAASLLYTEFLNRYQTRRWLHVGPMTYVAKSNRVEENFETHFLRSARPWVEELLEKYPFLFYNGVFDIVGSPVFTENYVDAFHWSGAMDFSTTNKTIMVTNGTKVFGYEKWSGNLRYMTIRDSGSSVSIDQPKIMPEIVKYFIEKLKFPTEFTRKK